MSPSFPRLRRSASPSRGTSRGAAAIGATMLAISVGGLSLGLLLQGAGVSKSVTRTEDGLRLDVVGAARDRSPRHVFTELADRVHATDPRPLVIAETSVDDDLPLDEWGHDAQWADRSSLEVLSYLARRVEDLRLLILVGARGDDPDAASDLLSMLGAVRSATVLHPRPLTPRGAAQLIRRLAPDTPASVCRDCHRAVGGGTRVAV